MSNPYDSISIGNSYIIKGQDGLAQLANNKRYIIKSLSGIRSIIVDNTDFFGADENLKQKICACCSENVEQYMAESQKLNRSSIVPQQKDMLHILKLEEKIVSKMKTVDSFSDIKLSIVYYPHKQQ